MTTTFARVTPIVTDPCTLPSARLPRRGRIVADDWTPRATDDLRDQNQHNLNLDQEDDHDND